MKYLKKTFEYANSKFLYLVLLSVVPAFMLCSRYSPNRLIDFLFRFDTMDFSSFGAVYRQMSFFSGRLWWVSAAGLIVMCAAVSIISGAIDRHMRIGVFTVSPKLVSTRLNFNFLATLKGLLVYVFIFEVNYLLVAVLIFWFGATLMPVVGAVLSGLVLALTAFVIVLEFSLLILWTPTILHTGLTGHKALAMSVRQTARELWRIAFSLMIPAAPILAMMMLSSALSLPLDLFFDAVFFSVMVVYYTILSYTIFYDVNGLERVDLENAKKDIWKE